MLLKNGVEHTTFLGLLMPTHVKKHIHFLTSRYINTVTILCFYDCYEKHLKKKESSPLVYAIKSLESED